MTLNVRITPMETTFFLYFLCFLDFFLFVTEKYIKKPKKLFQPVNGKWSTGYLVKIHNTWFFMLPGDLIIPVSGARSRDFRRSFSFLKNRLSALTLSNPGMRGSVIGGVLSLKKEFEKLKIEAKILETKQKIKLQWGSEYRACSVF